MKKIILKVVSFFTFAALMILNFTVLNLTGLTARASEINTSGNEVTCYSSYNNCWFNCNTIYDCGPCKTVKADEHWDRSTCIFSGC